MLKVLYVCSNHPTVSQGRMERYADELYRGVKAREEFDAMFVARVGPPVSIDAPRDGTRFRVSDEDPSLYYFYTGSNELEPVYGTARDKGLYTEDWRDFLLIHRPDVVHFHSLDWLGYDIIRETRRTLPDAAIVFTLHDLRPICHHNGEMVRTETLSLCYEASPRRCHQCFEQIMAQTFFLREHLIKTEFDLVDLFLAPTEFVRERYLEWGIDPGRVHYERRALIPIELDDDPADAGHRNRIGFFGRLRETDGVLILLEAMKILEREGTNVQLSIRASEQDNSEQFQERLAPALAALESSVRVGAGYHHRELPRLIRSVDWVVVPSIWWESAPLLVEEAMLYGRPVICSDIGGMAEVVQDGVNGLHFRVRDPYSLADAIRHATASEGLWERLRDGIPEPYSLGDHVAAVTGAYEELLAQGAASVDPAVQPA